MTYSDADGDLARKRTPRKPKAVKEEGSGDDEVTTPSKGTRKRPNGTSCKTVPARHSPEHPNLTLFLRSYCHTSVIQEDEEGRARGRR